jgi:hypothetical protein
MLKLKITWTPLQATILGADDPTEGPQPVFFDHKGWHYEVDTDTAVAWMRHAEAIEEGLTGWAPRHGKPLQRKIQRALHAALREAALREA